MLSLLNYNATIVGYSLYNELKTIEKEDFQALIIVYFKAYQTINSSWYH